MAKSSRTPEQRERDQATIADLYCRGIAQHEIADQMSMTVGQVSTDIAKIREGWKKAMVDRINIAKEEELAKIDKIEQLAFEGYARSCENKEFVRTKEAPTKVKKPAPGETTRVDKAAERLSQKLKVVEKITSVEGQAGNTAFLDIILQCVKQRCSILGIVSPQKVAFTDPSGEHEWKPTEEQKNGILVQAFTRIGIQIPAGMVQQQPKMIEVQATPVPAIEQVPTTNVFSQ
jgi:hypothetical protein